MTEEKAAFLEQRTLTLQVVTPVCIAAGTSLNSREYLYDPKLGKVYLLHQLEWFKFLHRKRLLPPYERYMKSQDSNSIPPYEWLQNCLGPQGATQQQLGKAIKAAVDVHVSLKKTGGRRGVNDIIPTMHLADGRVYIPGSSIKGMLRTAILFHLIRRDSWASRRKQYWQQIMRMAGALERANKNHDWQSQKQALKDLERTAQSIERELLCILDVDRRNMPLNDALRGLRCGDAMPVATSEKGNTTAILQKIDITNDYARRLPVFFESMLPGTTFQFSLTIEKAMLAKIGITSIDELLSIMGEYYRFLNATFQAAFPERQDLFTTMTEANAYLGRNNGFLQKTPMLALANSRRDTVPVVRAILQKQFHNHKHDDKLDKDVSPRTLKGTQYDHTMYLMGGVKIFDAH